MNKITFKNSTRILLLFAMALTLIAPSVTKAEDKSVSGYLPVVYKFPNNKPLPDSRQIGELTIKALGKLYCTTPENDARCLEVCGDPNATHTATLTIMVSPRPIQTNLYSNPGFIPFRYASVTGDYTITVGNESYQMEPTYNVSSGGFTADDYVYGQYIGIAPRAHFSGKFKYSPKTRTVSARAVINGTVNDICHFAGTGTGRVKL